MARGLAPVIKAEQTQGNTGEGGPECLVGSSQQPWMVRAGTARVRTGTGGPAQGDLEAGLEEDGEGSKRSQPLPASDSRVCPKLPARPPPSMVAYPAGPFSLFDDTFPNSSHSEHPGSILCQAVVSISRPASEAAMNSYMGCVLPNSRAVSHIDYIVNDAMSSCTVYNLHSCMGQLCEPPSSRRGCRIYLGCPGSGCNSRQRRLSGV